MSFDQTDDERDPVAANRHPSRHRRPNLLPRRKSGRSATPEEMLEDNSRIVRRLYTTGRITVIDGWEHFEAGARDEFSRLLQERRVLQDKVGPLRLPSGILFEIKHHGLLYCFAPYKAWLWDFIEAFNTPPPTPRGPHVKRDRIVWLYWYFRDRAIPGVKRAITKTRGPLVECVGCKVRDRYLSRPKDSMGVSRCRRCGTLGYRIVRDEAEFVRLPKITKAYLRRRFKISPRHLERILAVLPPTAPTPGSTVSLF